jgi:uncharacterized radical SAM protein YgiQ
MNEWLPTTKKEVDARGWDELDVILISGDAYVDHPSFGSALIGRIIEAEGLRVAIIPQPNWRDDLRDFRKLGAPRLFFGVSSGCMDPMINHYTALKRRRSTDAYTPGGEAGYRPDYAGVVYSQILKKLFPDVPIVMGGIEASLRRVTHYDYWSDSLKPSILVESGADLLVYGMGDKPIREICRLLQKGVPFSSLKTIPQTAFLQGLSEALPKQKKWKDSQLAPHKTCLNDKRSFAHNFKIIEEESNRLEVKRLTQRYENALLVINPPYAPLSEAELDESYDLPFTRLPHPKYKSRGPIPAYEMIKHSITLHRGCFGGCAFCTISAHQGKFVQSRSKESILKEVERVCEMPDFKGYISDLGGPSANMYRMQGRSFNRCLTCVRPSCIHPEICSNLECDTRPLLDLYAAIRSHPKVKKAFVTSGVRYDLFVSVDEAFMKKNHCEEYMETLVREHVSGRLKVAPEHTSDHVLQIMRKPSFRLFEIFKRRFDLCCKKNGLTQQLVPYFISSHPGSRLEDMAELAVRTKDLGYKLEQVQDFTPSPMTLATVMYYSGYNPATMHTMYVARTPEEKSDQLRFFFWYQQENREWIRSQLKAMGKEDLVHLLIRERPTPNARKAKRPAHKAPKRPEPNSPANKRPRFYR